MAENNNDLKTEAMGLLRQAASHKECSAWLNQHLGGGTLPARFKQDELTGLPTLSDDGRFLVSVLPGDMQMENLDNPDWGQWAKGIVRSNVELKSPTIALFVHTDFVSIDENGDRLNLVACNPDVHANRFASTCSSPPGESCFVIAVGYKIDPNKTSGCEVCPMIYEDALLASKDNDKKYATRISVDDVLQVFEILFDECPTIQRGDISLAIVRLLTTIETCFNLNELAGWRKLLLALGRHVFGKRCLDMLNALQVDQEDIMQFTLALFSSIVPLKFGFLMGESFIAKEHHAMNHGHGRLNYQCSFRVLELKAASESNPVPPDFPHLCMKKMSNTKLMALSNSYEPGSAKDFLLEFLLGEIKEGTKLPSEVKNYFKTMEKHYIRALDRAIKWSEHNSHLLQIRKEYEAIVPSALGDAEGKKYLLKKLFKAKNTANVDFQRHCPKYFWFLVVLLVDFEDAGCARAMASLLVSSIGDLFAPSKSISIVAEMSAHVDRLSLLHSCRKQIGKDLYEHCMKVKRFPKKKNLRPQVHLLSRKITPHVVELVEKYGLLIIERNIPEDWNGTTHKNLTKRMKLDKVGGLVHGIVNCLLGAAEVVRANTLDNPPIMYGSGFFADNLTPETIFSMDTSELFLYKNQEVDIFSIVTSFLSNEELRTEINDIFKEVDDEMQQKKEEEKQKKKEEEEKNEARQMDSGFEDGAGSKVLTKGHQNEGPAEGNESDDESEDDSIPLKQLAKPSLVSQPNAQDGTGARLVSQPKDDTDSHLDCSFSDDNHEDSQVIDDQVTIEEVLVQEDMAHLLEDDQQYSIGMYDNVIVPEALEIPLRLMARNVKLAHVVASHAAEGESETEEEKVKIKNILKGTMDNSMLGGFYNSPEGEKFSKIGLGNIEVPMRANNAMELLFQYFNGVQMKLQKVARKLQETSEDLAKLRVQNTNYGILKKQLDHSQSELKNFKAKNQDKKQRILKIRKLLCKDCNKKLFAKSPSTPNGKTNAPSSQSPQTASTKKDSPSPTGTKGADTVKRSPSRGQRQPNGSKRPAQPIGTCSPHKAAKRTKKQSPGSKNLRKDEPTTSGGNKTRAQRLNKNLVVATGQRKDKEGGLVAAAALVTPTCETE